MKARWKQAVLAPVRALGFDVVRFSNARSLPPRRKLSGAAQPKNISHDRLSQPNHSDDLRLVERFSYDWNTNAHVYKTALDDLQAAARRLLPILLTDGLNDASLSNLEKGRLYDIKQQVTCLARQPLFFPEMFHGVTLLADGTILKIPSNEALHLRAIGLLSNADCAAIGEIYERLLRARDAPLRIAEIGSAAGRGSTPIAGSFVERSEGTLYCIDPWPGSLYFAFLANMQIFELERTVVPIRSSSIDAGALFEDGSLDGVFIDGSHIYSDVLADIDTYLPKVRRGGFLFGHDLHDLPSRFEREELLSISMLNNATTNYKNAREKMERVNVHPGVILSVQDRFGDDVERFAGSAVWAKQA